VEGIGHWNLPCYLLAVWAGSLAAKYIYTKDVASGWRTRVDSGIWNLHCAVPNASSRVDSCRNLEAGIPGPTFLVMRFMEINIQVCPFSLWRNLKLFVPLDILEIGTDEDFGHVPIPQSVRLG